MPTPNSQELDLSSLSAAAAFADILAETQGLTQVAAGAGCLRDGQKISPHPWRQSPADGAVDVSFAWQGGVEFGQSFCISLVDLAGQAVYPLNPKKPDPRLVTDLHVDPDARLGRFTLPARETPWDCTLVAHPRLSPADLLGSFLEPLELPQAGAPRALYTFQALAHSRVKLGVSNLPVVPTGEAIPIRAMMLRDGRPSTAPTHIRVEVSHPLVSLDDRVFERLPLIFDQVYPHGVKSLPWWQRGLLERIRFAGERPTVQRSPLRVSREGRTQPFHGTFPSWLTQVPGPYNITVTATIRDPEFGDVTRTVYRQVQVISRSDPGRTIVSLTPQRTQTGMRYAVKLSLVDRFNNGVFDADLRDLKLHAEGGCRVVADPHRDSDGRVAVDLEVDPRETLPLPVTVTAGGRLLGRLELPVLRDGEPRAHVREGFPDLHEDQRPAALDPTRGEVTGRILPGHDLHLEIPGAPAHVTIFTRERGRAAVYALELLDDGQGSCVLIGLGRGTTRFDLPALRGRGILKISVPEDPRRWLSETIHRNAPEVPFERLHELLAFLAGPPSVQELEILGISFDSEPEG